MNSNSDTRAERLRSVLLQGPALIIPISGLILSAIGYLVAVITGPIQVWVGVNPTSEYASPWYLCTVGLPAGMLAAEAVFDFIAYRWSLRALFLPLSLALVTIAILLRWPLLIPFSGHGAFLGLALMHELLDYRPTSSLRLLLLAAVLAQSVYYKIFSWGDSESLLAGILLGILVWTICRLLVALSPDGDRAT